MKPTQSLFALLLGVSLATPAHAQSWSDFAGAFQLLPCSDGWAGCVVDGYIVQPELVPDAEGNPVASHMRVGWFDLQATRSFSPFATLSEYTGNLPFGNDEAADDDGVAALAEVAEVGEVTVDNADIEAAMDDEGRAALEASAAAAEAERAAEAELQAAEAAAAEAERQQAEARRRAEDEARRQREAEAAAAAAADAAEKERLKREAEAAAAAARKAEEERVAAEAARKKAEAERQAKLAAEAEARRLAEEKRKAEEEARKRAEEEARKKAEAEAEAARAAAEEAARQKAEAEAAALAKKQEEEEAAAAAAAAVAVETPAVPKTCELDELVQLEPMAMLGKLDSEQISSCEKTLASAPKMTDKSKISRLLMVNAFSSNDKATWEILIKRHLDEIDQSDPDLCYKYAQHLRSKGAGSAQQVIKWAGVALDNRTVWSGDTFKNRVYNLHKFQTLAAQKLWLAKAQAYSEDPTDETLGDQVEKYRAQTKVLSREWYEYAKVAGKDTTKALTVCMSAAGTKDYCEAG